MTLLFFLTSCALFKGQTSLKTLDQIKLLDAIQLTGEGTGRLSLGESQYLFGVDSILKENFDWILAVSIPLHGEEVMILPNLKQKNPSDEEIESFEQRIDREFHKIQLNKIVTTQEFLKGLRSLVRFNLSATWQGERICSAQQNDLVCEYDGDTFYVLVTESEIKIKKFLGNGRSLSLDGKNLTDSFFKKTDIRLYSNESDLMNKKSSFSLELFWKD